VYERAQIEQKGNDHFKWFATCNASEMASGDQQCTQDSQTVYATLSDLRSTAENRTQGVFLTLMQVRACAGVGTLGMYVCVVEQGRLVSLLTPTLNSASGSVVSCRVLSVHASWMMKDCPCSAPDVCALPLSMQNLHQENLKDIDPLDGWELFGNVG
jgi:hypothetical protein